MSESTSTDVEQVYACLINSLSQDNVIRAAAEKQLHAWEHDSVPGFIGSLLKVAQQVQGVAEESRLLAVVVAKNAVGSSWRKTVALREWSHVPEEEKQFVRSAATAILLQDPSDLIALQAGLLITNIGRFDVPRPWSTLIADLATASAVESSTPVASKVRALTTLKYLVRALRSKRFILEVPEGVSSSHDIDALSSIVDRDRTTMNQQLKALLRPLRQQWEHNFSALLQQGQEWEKRGALAVAGLATLRELLLMLMDLRDVEAEFDALMVEGAQAAGAVAGPLFGTAAAGVAAAAAAVENGSAGSHITLMSKCWERLVQIALVAMDRHTVAFAVHVPAWASLCVNTALLGMDSAAVHGIRPKSRVLLTRFVARAMLQPFYRQESAREEEHMMVLLPSAARARMSTALPALRAAAACLDDMLSAQDGRCAALVQAVVSKYIILAPEELEEWETDPEGFARQVDVETSPDADTPRPCGVALLESMLERSEESVASALVGLASALQAQPLTRESVLPREAVYRAVGEVFRHLRTKVDFGAWYAGELRMLLTSAELTGLEGSVLRARALWLVGVCGEDLKPEAWGDAFGLAVQHMSSADVAVALMAVSAVTALVAVVLDEQQFVGRPMIEQRQLLDTLGGGGGDENFIFDNNLNNNGSAEAATAEEEDVFVAANAEFNAHMAAVEGSLNAIMTSCFGMLPQLGEAESMVRVLQCVSATVELLGDRVRPHLESITGALPRCWSVVQGSTTTTNSTTTTTTTTTSSSNKQEGTGARTRLHCSLLAMLAHLIAKLGAAAAEDPQIAGVLLPLLHHATDTADVQAEPLMEDGLKLWLAVLQAAPTISPALLELVGSRLGPILQRGKDNATALRIAEGYVLHGGSAAIVDILPQLSAAIVACISTAMTAMAPKQGSQPNSIVLGALPPETASEAGAAVSLLGVLQRVNDVHVLEAPVRAAAAMVCADYGGGVLRLPSRSLPVLEAALEIVYRVLFTAPGTLATMTGGDPAAANRLVDRWIALSSTRDIGELFIPSLGAAGRARRHNAAVALCSFIVADAAPETMRGEGRAAQALVLGMKAAREQCLFQEDQELLANLQPDDPEHQDQLLLRRVLMAREDALRGVDAMGAVRAAAGHVAGWQGQSVLLASLDAIDPMFRDQMAKLLAGQLTESETDAAVESMMHAQLS